MAKAFNWPKTSLEQHVDLLAGFAFKSSQFTDDPSDIPLVKGADVQQGYIDWDECKRWPKSLVHRLERFWLQEGDVIIAMDRPWVPSGLKWAWIKQGSPKSLLVQRVARLRGKNGLFTDYLRYLIGSPQFTDYISPIVTGVNIPHISGSQILGFTFSLPPLSSQRKIAAILSAYDNLIENNKRRIKILEEMAQMIYREWFVHFRFPGHEEVKMVDSSIGPIPEGWEVKKLSAVVETQYGYTESASEAEVGPKYLRGMDINKATYIRWESVPYCRINPADHIKFKLSMGDVVVIRMADPGKVGIVEKDIDAVFASYLIRLHVNSSSLSPYYLFYFLLSDRYQDYVTGASTGTTRRSASAGVITDVDVLTPTYDVCHRFEDEVAPIRGMINNMLDRNFQLQRTRDLLLPKLISGVVNVDGLRVPDTKDTT